MLEGAAPRGAAAKRIWLPALTAAGLQQLTAVLLAAVLAETLLLRGVTRIGVHVPKGEGVAGVFQAASFRHPLTRPATWPPTATTPSSLRRRVPTSPSPSGTAQAVSAMASSPYPNS